MTYLKLGYAQIALDFMARDCFWTPLGRLKLAMSGAVLGAKPKISGPLNIRNLGKLELGDGVRINSGYRLNFVGGSEKFSIWVWKSGHVRIGHQVGLSNCLIVSMSIVEIGEGTFIGGGVRIYDTDFHPLGSEDRNSGRPAKTKGVSISSNCFIGAHATILKGTNIGSQSIIGAGSVVSGEIPENQIWAGNPARYIRDL